jgi:prevent-host-death family protein
MGLRTQWRATPCYGDPVETISQREMRNNSAEVLRRVAGGESFIVTNGGVPAAVLTPASADEAARRVASGRLRPGSGVDLSRLPAPVLADVDTGDVLAQDRG